MFNVERKENSSVVDKPLYFQNWGFLFLGDIDLSGKKEEGICSERGKIN